MEHVLEVDAALAEHAHDWFVNEVRHQMKRVLKRLDLTARSTFGIVEPGSCFGGSLFELALAADRAYMLEQEGVSVALSPLNGGSLPMSNGLTRLQTRFLNDPHKPEALLVERSYDGSEADEQGLVTMLVDELDWEDEVRIFLEKRASFSPDAMTGMEANLRFAGPETMETKVFGRLTAWQNWIFQRPNAVGPEGALGRYGSGRKADFDRERV